MGTKAAADGEVALGIVASVREREERVRSRDGKVNDGASCDDEDFRLMKSGASEAERDFEGLVDVTGGGFCTLRAVFFGI